MEPRLSSVSRSTRYTHGVVLLVIVSLMYFYHDSPLASSSAIARRTRFTDIIWIGVMIIVVFFDCINIWRNYLSFKQRKYGMINLGVLGALVLRRSFCGLTK